MQTKKCLERRDDRPPGDFAKTPTIAPKVRRYYCYQKRNTSRPSPASIYSVETSSLQNARKKDEHCSSEIEPPTYSRRRALTVSSYYHLFLSNSLPYKLKNKNEVRQTPSTISKTTITTTCLSLITVRIK